jgi:signal transduction histidine kinase/CheY-like chemotaxis protein
MEMDNSKIKANLIRANFSTLKYISLITFGFSVLFIITDFFYHSILKENLLLFYRILDISLFITAITGVYFFWVYRKNNQTLQKVVTILFPFLILIWAATITGSDFQIFGLSTFIIVLLFCTFFLYLDLVVSIFLYSSSCIALITTVYLRGEFNENFLSMLFLLIPTNIFCVLITYRNYKNKKRDLLNQLKIMMMNKGLLNSNENLEKIVSIRTREIQFALEKAEESDRLKTAFLHNISHEIRTPLNAVAGFSKLITKPNISLEKIKRFSESIRTNSDKLIQIVTDVIEISQIQAKEVKVKNTEFDIVALIKEIFSRFTQKAKEKKIDLLIKSDHSYEKFLIEADQKKIEVVLMHLIDNAIKFTSKGHVEINFMIESEKLILSVSDTGIGISDKMKMHIFEPFRQAETEMSKTYGGNGLGLAIIKSYIELMRGTIAFTSEVNKGSTFALTIPIIKSIGRNIKKKEVSHDSIADTLLISEDDVENYEYLLELLGDYHLNILYASNGNQTIDLCRANSTVNLILMDIKMPVMDGYTAAKMIKEFRSDIIIVAQTEYVRESDKEKFIGVFDDYVTKPIREEELKQTLSKYLNIQ